MANISTLLNTIKTAVYGRDMRNALHDSINAVNKDVETKEPKIIEGTSSQYFRGDKKLADFPNAVRNSNLTGLSMTTNSSINSSDTIIKSLGKIQAQINDRFKLSGGILTGDLSMGGYKIIAKKITAPAEEKFELTANYDLDSHTVKNKFELNSSGFDISVTNTKKNDGTVYNHRDNTIENKRIISSPNIEVISDKYIISSAQHPDLITIEGYDEVHKTKLVVNNHITATGNIYAKVGHFSNSVVAENNVTACNGTFSNLLSSKLVNVTDMFRVGDDDTAEQKQTMFSITRDEIYMNTNVHVDDEVTLRFGGKTTESPSLNENQFILPTNVKVRKGSDPLDPYNSFMFQNSAGNQIMLLGGERGLKLYNGGNTSFEMTKDNLTYLRGGDKIIFYAGDDLRFNVSAKEATLRFSGNNKVSITANGCKINGLLYMNKVDETAGITTSAGYSAEEINYLNNNSMQNIIIDILRRVNALEGNV